MRGGKKQPQNGEKGQELVAINVASDSQKQNVLNWGEIGDLIERIEITHKCENAASSGDNEKNTELGGNDCSQVNEFTDTERGVFPKLADNVGNNCEYISHRHS